MSNDSLNHKAPERKSAWRWPIVLATTVIVLVVGIVATVAIRQLRESKHRVGCKQNLKAIGLALHQYHDEYGSLPPAYIEDSDGKRLHSWRVLILPQLGQQELYARYRFDEPWDGPNNARLIDEMPSVYRCPVDGRRAAGTTNYSAIVGVETMWPLQFASKMQMVTDGTSNTVMVVESHNLDAKWTEPRDLTVEEYRRGVNGNEAPCFSSHHQGGAMACLADGGVRFFYTHIDPETLRFLGNARGGGPMPIAGLKVPMNFSADQAPEAKPHTALTKTIVYSTLDVPHQQDRNLVSCATMPLAWEELKNFLGVDEVILEPSSPMVDHLNRCRFPRSALADEAYLAMSGSIESGILKRITEARARKFPNATLPLPEPTQTDEFLVYTYLFKRLPFLTRFDKLTEPLTFQAADATRRVQSFGIESYKLGEPREVSLREQVDVQDYVSDDDFVLSLKTESDRIVLAKVAPGGSLDETWQQVLKRIKQPHGGAKPPQLVPGEKLIVPLVSLFVKRNYDELEGRRIIDRGGAPYRLRHVLQYIKFQLDESGAKLESSVEFIGESGPGLSPQPPKPREFLFNKPFLLALHQSNSDTPYLVCWIANEEMLVEEPR